MPTDILLVPSVYISAEMQNINGSSNLDVFPFLVFAFYTFMQHVCENTICTIDETENIRFARSTTHECLAMAGATQYAVIGIRHFSDFSVFDTSGFVLHHRVL